MSESRLRIIVACGAAGGIAATFNAPITGLFFGFEIVLREFSLDAIFATILSAVTADLVSRAFFGSAPFFAEIPHDLVVAHPYTYLLIAVLGVAAGLIGFGFKTVLYKSEDVVDRLWKGRPEWARPAVGGLALGALLLALPQMYGVGYPVMDQMVAGNVVLWLLVVLMVGKVVATSLTLSIGGSGGVFAPSLFTGAAAGMAFGVVVQHLFGPAVELTGDLRGGRHGRRLQRSRTGTAHGDRQRGRDDRELRAHPAGDARRRASPRPCRRASATAASTPPSCSAVASTSNGPKPTSVLQTAHRRGRHAAALVQGRRRCRLVGDGADRARPAPRWRRRVGWSSSAR